MPTPSIASNHCSADRPDTRLATRLVFLVAGFGIACWAPLVPFAKTRLGVDDGTLGLLLLCIGIGSIVAMLATGPMTARWGSKPIIVVSGLAMAIVLPTLANTSTPTTLALSLLCLGAALGSIDVAMNVHAVEVERAADMPLMSGFHALFSLGGFAGAGLVTALLSRGITLVVATTIGAIIVAIGTVLAWPRLLHGRHGEAGPLFQLPRGIVLLLAGLAAVAFLTEGAMLDWGALLISSRGLAASDAAGIGYMLFSVAMTLGRFAGDRITVAMGDRAVLRWGGVLAVAGFVLLLVAPSPVALGGFLLIGLGASNIVPVFFRRAGTQDAMPAALAVGAVTTVGYAGILAGPAAIGFVARATSLLTAFWLVTALFCLVPLTAGIVTRK